jgi:Na+-driven multidrug efflux pump
MAITDEELGTTDIKKLLIKQAAPASIGILFMSLNILIDTIFVDNGSVHCYRSRNSSFPNNVPNFIMGMAIGVGGGSVLSSFRCKIVKKQNYFCQSNYDDLPLASVL